MNDDRSSPQSLITDINESVFEHLVRIEGIRVNKEFLSLKGLVLLQNNVHM